jgi:hypothetical protein
MARRMRSDDVDIDFNEENTQDFVYDEVTGGRGKKHVLSALNKKKIGKFEMDEIFCEFS